MSTGRDLICFLSRLEIIFKIVQSLPDAHRKMKVITAHVKRKITFSGSCPKTNVTTLGKDYLKLSLSRLVSIQHRPFV